ncbi:MAG: NUDIX domain-containing protein [Saprospiraceae bacterium]|nr:NUDIX domain-containing protein [Saprospiraceae bacterium]
MNISAQKYKIWVNTSWLVFLSEKDYKKDQMGPPIYLLLQHPNTRKIVETIQKLQSGEINFPTLIVTKNKTKAWSSLLNALKIVYAAGGLVQNPNGKYLFFYRRGSWDLPKGKLDKGENNRQAAIREVKEEVGLDCKIIKGLPTTYHTYMDKGKLVIKETAWYKMKSETSKVILQYEEDIEKYKWVGNSQLVAIRKYIYPNLLAMLNTEID